MKPGSEEWFRAEAEETYNHPRMDIESALRRVWDEACEACEACAKESVNPQNPNI